MASIGEATAQIKIAHAVGLANPLRAISMRGLIMLFVLAFGAIWAFDAYEYDGRYSRAAWQQANAEGQNFSQEVKPWVGRTLSSH